VGRTICDRDGQELGALDEVHRDPDSGRLTWGTVKTGRFSKQVVPLGDARTAGEEIRVSAAKSHIDAAPAPGRGGLNRDLEDRLRSHYGAGGGPAAGAGAGAAAATAATPGPAPTPAPPMDHTQEAEPVVDRGDQDSRHDRKGMIAAARSRQREEFGGFNWGAAFFGWLVAVGMAVILTAILSAAGTAIGLTKLTESEAESNADTIGIVGGALLIAVLVLAYYAGGYVAGRLSRFDGARQGLGTWIFGLLVTIALAVAGAILGSEYNVFQQLNLPRIPVEEGDLTTGGLIALGAIVLGSLVAAILGGKVGERYHRKVDRAAYESR